MSITSNIVSSVLTFLTYCLITIYAAPAYSQSPPPGWCTHAGAQRFNADINGDGRIDALCHDRNTGMKWVALNDGTRLVQRWSDPSSGWCIQSGAQLLIGDVNGDHRADLICKDADGIRIDYGAPDFFRGTDFVIDTSWCTHAGASFSVADMNADGRDDLVCRNPDGRMHVDFANSEGRFSGVTEFFGTCSTTTRTSFVAADPTEHASATAAGRMRVDSTSVLAAADHQEASIAASGFSGSALTASTVYVAAPIVLAGRYNFAGAPLGSWLQTGVAVKLSVVDRVGRELCSDEQVLSSYESPGFSASGPVGRVTRPMSCSARHAGSFTARTILRAWTTAVGPVSSSINADISVPFVSVRTCAPA